MYEMKKNGAGQAVGYHPGLEQRHSARRRIERALREGLEKDYFAIELQPVLALDTVRPIGAEALLRLQHPNHPALGPGEFIPVAEESGLMPQIGMLAFEKAVDAGADLIRQGADDDFYIAVNVSTVQLTGAFQRFVLETIAASGLAPRHVVLEITENFALDGNSEGDDVLVALKQAGIRIALDDFGAGYSSLAYIASLEPDMVKIDRSFVRSEPESGQAGATRQALLNAMTTLCRDLGLPMIGEGIETEAEFETCRRLGITHGQGYYFCPPMPVSRFQIWQRHFGKGDGHKKPPLEAAS